MQTKDCCKSLVKNIKEQYGIEALQQLQLWEKSELKGSNYRNHRIFTLRCISQNLTPVSIKLKPNHKVSASARKIIEKAERQLMQDRVRAINRVIEASDNNRDNNRDRLASLVTSTDLEKCGNFLEKVRKERYNRVKVRQVRKFHILYGKSSQYSNNNVIDLNTNRSSQGVNANRLGHSNNRPNHNSQLEGTDNNKWVINLSKTSLTQA